MDLSIEVGILEEIKSSNIHDLDIGIVYSSCECVKDFWSPLLMTAPDLDERDSIKMLLLS